MASKLKIISRYSVPFTVGSVIGSGAASLSSGRGCPVFCYANQKSLDSYFSSITDGFRGLSRFCNCAAAVSCQIIIKFFISCKSGLFSSL